MIKKTILSTFIFMNIFIPLERAFGDEPTKLLRISFNKDIQGKLAENILNSSTDFIDQKLSGLQIPNLDTKEAIPVPKIFLELGEEEKKQKGFFSSLANTFGHNKLSFNANNITIKRAKLGNFTIECEGDKKDDCTLLASLDHLALNLNLKVNNQNEKVATNVLTLENLSIRIGGETCPKKPFIKMKLELGKDKRPFFSFSNKDSHISIPAGCALIAVAKDKEGNKIDDRKIKEIFTTPSFRPQWNTIKTSMSAAALVSPLMKDLLNLIDFDKTFNEVLSNSEQFKILEERLNKTMVKEVYPMINKTIDDDPALNAGSPLYSPVATFQDYVNKEKIENILNKLLLHYKGEEADKNFKVEGITEKDFFNLLKNSKDSFVVFSLNEKKKQLEEIKEEKSSNKDIKKKISMTIELIDDLVKKIEKVTNESEKEKEKESLAKIAIQMSNPGNFLNLKVFDTRCSSKEELKKWKEKSKKNAFINKEKESRSQIHGSINMAWFNNIFDQLQEKKVFRFCLNKIDSDLFCDDRNEEAQKSDPNKIIIDLKSAPHIHISKNGEMKFSTSLSINEKEEKISAKLSLKANSKGAIELTSSVDFKDSLLSDENKKIASKIVDLLLGYVTSSYKMIDLKNLSSGLTNSSQTENSNVKKPETVEMQIPLIKVNSVELDAEKRKIKFNADLDSI